MPAVAHTSVLLGRDRELRRIDDHLAAARLGKGSGLLISGEPGSGKTALMVEARGRADGFRVVACRGVEWESELPFSGLHELLAPLLPELPALPAPQRQALAGALGLEPIDHLHTLNVYAGTLSLLIEATRSRPVLILVDDLHWIDTTTAGVLSFVVRRLGGETIALLAAGRPGAVLPGVDAAAPLEPLDRAAVAELAGRRLGRPLPDSAVEDLTSASAGNPLAILESVGHFGDELWLRGSLLDGPLPVGALIERGFADRLGALGPDARAALELVATCVSDDAALIEAALEDLGVPRTALLEAEAAGVVTLQQARVRFAHPLLRSLVHRQTEPAQLRRCHGVLAAAVGCRDEALRAWHAASAATAAAEPLAAALHAAAERFAVRGGHLAAAQALARAAELSPDPDARADRLILAGRSAYLAGRATWANALFAEARRTAVDPVIRVRGEFEHARSDAQVLASHDVAARFLEVSDGALGIDDSMAAWAASSAAIEGLISGRLEPTLAAVQRLEAFRGQPGISREAAEEIDSVVGVVRVLTGGDGSGAASAALREAGERRLAADSGNHEYVAEALVWIEAFDLAERLSGQMIARARAEGDVYTLAGALWSDGYRRHRTGDWDGAVASLSESIRLAETIDLHLDLTVATATLAIVEASRGDDTFQGSIEAIEARARQYGFGIIDEYTRTALGLLDLGAGRGPQAAEHFERVRRHMDEAGQVEPCVLSWPADLVDAYLLAGDRERASAALEQLRERAAVARRPWAAGSVARLDGALAEDDAFEAHFERALALLAEARAPFDRARAQLAYGQRLRRARRKIEARAQLTPALAEFERLRAEPWAEQARRELGASTATLRKGAQFDPNALTPQELQVAGLVAAGSSNKEAAGAMFLSPKTIETHLSRIYRKLGVASRTQLAARLRDRD